MRTLELKGVVKIEKKVKRVHCTECGYKMPLSYASDAECKGVFAICKGRNCRRPFEIRIENGKQINTKEKTVR